MYAFDWARWAHIVSVSASHIAYEMVLQETMQQNSQDGRRRRCTEPNSNSFRSESFLCCHFQYIFLSRCWGASSQVVNDSLWHLCVPNFLEWHSNWMQCISRSTEYCFIPIQTRTVEHAVLCRSVFMRMHAASRLIPISNAVTKYYEYYVRNCCATYYLLRNIRAETSKKMRRFSLLLFVEFNSSFVCVLHALHWMHMQDTFIHKKHVAIAFYSIQKYFRLNQMRFHSIRNSPSYIENVCFLIPFFFFHIFFTLH